MIQDITPLKDLVNLEKLHLNRNKITVIEALRQHPNLQSLGLFHNEIFNFDKSLEILSELFCKFKLTELSIDGNPITSSAKFKYSLIMCAGSKIKILDEEKVGDFEIEVAKEYFDAHGLSKPKFEFLEPKHPKPKDSKKKVKFEEDSASHDEENPSWMQLEIKKLEKHIADLVVENGTLKQ